MGIVAGQKFNRRVLPFKHQLTILSLFIGLEGFSLVLSASFPLLSTLQVKLWGKYDRIE